MEFGYPAAITTGWQADETIPGLKMAPKASKVSPIRNLVTRIHTIREVWKLWGLQTVQTGEDVSKSECLSVMDRIEASALTWKGANLKQIFHGKEGGIPVKVQYSTTPRSEKRTDRNLASQWNSIDCYSVKFRVNRLQIRIAKATHDENCNLVKNWNQTLSFRLEPPERVVKCASELRWKPHGSFLEGRKRVIFPSYSTVGQPV